MKALKTCTYIANSAAYILFQSFVTRAYILNNQKVLIGLNSCFRPSFLTLWASFYIIQSLNRLPYQIEEITVCLSLISSPDHARVTLIKDVTFALE